MRRIWRQSSSSVDGENESVNYFASFEFNFFFFCDQSFASSLVAANDITEEKLQQIYTVDRSRSSGIDSAEIHQAEKQLVFLNIISANFYMKFLLFFVYMLARSKMPKSSSKRPGIVHRSSHVSCWLNLIDSHIE